jgi:hypothetical protein
MKPVLLCVCCRYTAGRWWPVMYCALACLHCLHTGTYNYMTLESLDNGIFIHIVELVRLPTHSTRESLCNMLR